jgi:hypothetical protein
MTRLDNLRLELGANVMRKRRVYLDIRFWIYFRDVLLGSPASPVHGELYRLLADLVEAGDLVCPIEQHVFLEAYKQGDRSRRIVVTDVIDKLSGGIALLSQPDRVYVETHNFLLAAPTGAPFPATPAEKMWTRAAYILGQGELHSPTMTPGDLAKLNELFHQELWGMTLSDVLRELGPDFVMPDSPGAKTAAVLNENKQQAANRLESRLATHLAELRGFFDVYADVLGEVIGAQFRAVVGGPSPTEEERNGAGRKVAAMLGAACATHDLSHQLPTAHVLATLFTNVQWDQGRRYRPNDLADFGHAAAALPYCDVFLTERSLAAAVTQTGLTETYHCRAIADLDDAVAFFQNPSA